jgi:nucleoside-diphosphate-sugar epimerase
MKVIVLGAGGFIGSSLVKAFPDWIGVTRKELDLTDQKAVDAYFENVESATVVVHCAVIGGSRLRPDDGDVAYKNLLMFENVARHTKKMIYFSSGAALRGNPPTDPYGFSKWLVDRRIETLGDGYHSLRIWGCYGEGELPTRFSAVCKEKGHVVIPKDRYFDFIDVKDVCTIVKSFVEGHRQEKFYNLVRPGDKMLLSQWATEFGATTYEIEDRMSLGESYCAQHTARI